VSGRNILHQKTSALVEAAIFAAIAIIFNLVFYYIPFLTVFVNLVMPLPIAICGQRHGFKWSLLSLIVASALTAMLINPLQGLFYLGVYGVLALILGYCLFKKISPVKSVLLSSIGALIGYGANIAIAIYLMGINPITTFFNGLDNAMPQITAFLNGAGMSPEGSLKAQSDFAQSVSMMKIIMPGAMLMYAPIISFINYVASRKIILRMGQYVEGFPDFLHWNMPKVVVPLYFIAFFAISYLNQHGLKESHWFLLSANVWAITSILLLIQAFAVIYWFIKMRGYPRILLYVAGFLVCIMPMFSLILTYVGAYDLLFNFRKIPKNKAAKTEGK
jgi:uncharacterized protein YybS (DUF2232 family)